MFYLIVLKNNKNSYNYPVTNDINLYRYIAKNEKR